MTTQDDVVDNLDGVVSLREAIDTANAAAGPTTLLLDPSGRYELDLCGPDDDTNATGDLDYTGTGPLTVEGGGATLAQTCPEQRILQTVAEDGAVTIVDTTFAGGQVFELSGTRGAAVLHAGALDLHRVATGEGRFARRSAFASDPSVSGADLRLIDSTVTGRLSHAVENSFGSVTITGSTLSTTFGDKVVVNDGVLNVTDSLVEQGDGSGLRVSGHTGLLTLARTTVRETGSGGVVCDGCGGVDITGSTITGNFVFGGRRAAGVEVRVGPGSPRELAITVTDSIIRGNTTELGWTGGIGVFADDAPAGAPPPQIVITRSIITGSNAVRGPGGGGIHAEIGDVRIDNSTLSANRAFGSGGAVYAATGAVQLRHATVVANVGQADGSSIHAGGDLRLFGSIVVNGDTDIPECAVGGTAVSEGYSVLEDTSCGSGGPGDRQNVRDPRLSPLLVGGDPDIVFVPYHVPLRDSPALGAVPADKCTILDVDQRGAARPQGEDCEAGSVEVDETTFGEPPGGGGGGELPKTGHPVAGLFLIGVALAVGGAALRLAGRLSQARPTRDRRAVVR